jgi:hypothetical protein
MSHPHKASRDLECWLDALCELDADAWRAIGRAYAGGTDVARMHAARRALAALVSRECADVEVWMLRDQIETICHVAAGRGCDASRAARREFLAARVAAEWATLAIAFGDRIPIADASLLREPFAETLPRFALRLV